MRWERTGEWRQPKKGQHYEGESGVPNVAAEDSGTWHWILRPIDDPPRHVQVEQKARIAELEKELEHLRERVASYDPPPAAPERPSTERVVRYLYEQNHLTGASWNLCFAEALRRVRVHEKLVEHVAESRWPSNARPPLAEKIEKILDGDTP